MTLGLVRVMGAGVVVISCVEEVCTSPIAMCKHKLLLDLSFSFLSKTNQS